MSVSLDGFVAPTDGSTDWVAVGRSDDGASWTVEALSNAGAHLMGATTYAGWAAYWPGASGPFAEPMNEIPKVVFSDSLYVRRLGRDGDRRRRPGRSHHRLQRRSRRPTVFAAHRDRADRQPGSGRRHLAATRSHPTTIVAFMNGWMLQWYG